MKVLGIETSCDETGVAIYDSADGLVANQLHSQASLHEVYGGVVPELAARDHAGRLLPLIEAALREAGIARDQIDGVAFTQGPGLVGALIVGASAGRALAFALDVPAFGVHHMEAHLLAPLLEHDAADELFPAVALLISGGHTQLVKVSGPGNYQLLGETLDDAVGEAFDKVARLLGLPYPGGPELERLARQGDAQRLALPRPMTNRPGLDFSFSGLKTEVAVAARKMGLTPGDPGARGAADLAAAFQLAAVDTLAIKARRALLATGFKRLIVSGGVAANASVRSHLRIMTGELGARLICPSSALCGDNGAMVAFLGCLRLRAGARAGLSLNVRNVWPLA